MWICSLKLFASTMKASDVILIRHAESYYNQQTRKFLERKNITYSWQALGEDKEYLTTLKYGRKFIDCSITEKGIQECQQAKNKLANYKPDLILVSPLNRALQTCKLIFQSPTCPVIVEPSLSESLRSACDFSSDTKLKIARYPRHNFDPTLSKGPFWFIKNESKQNQAKYQHIIDHNFQKDHDVIVKCLLNYMLQTKIYEAPPIMRRRADNIKLLLKKYRQKYDKIAVISHHSTLRFLLAKEFNENDQPPQGDIANCEIRSVSIDDL